MRVEDITDKQQWDDFVTSHEEANFLHSWQWGEFHISRGKKVVRRGVFEEDNLVGVVSLNDSIHEHKLLRRVAL